MAGKKKKTETEELSRIPIVTILGHVDHGKTTILDQIRESNVQEKEAGGITQKISVFTIDHKRLEDTSSPLSQITFVDTPGHEAFDLMRKRGGDIADIVLLVIAANDGIKPQTEESIEIINSSNAKPIVVINKVDLPNIKTDAIKRNLSSKGIQVEGFGGDVPVVEVSGKTGDGIDTLLDTITLVVDVEGLSEVSKLPDKAKGKAYILESVKDTSMGFVSTLIVTQGTMNKGDDLVTIYDKKVVSEKIKGFISETGENISRRDAGQGARLLGISTLLDLGVEVFSADKKDKKSYDQFFEIKEEKKKSTSIDEDSEEEDDWFAQMFDGEEEAEEEEEKTLNVIVKSSSEGSLQAIKSTLSKVNVEGYTPNLINADVGNVTLGDVDRADVTKSIILAFEVSTDPTAVKAAEEKKVLIRDYQIIYKLIEEVTDVLTAKATPDETEEDLGDAEVREVFILSDGSKVLGGRVSNGMMKRDMKCYIVRNDDIVAEGKITSLKHNKKDITEAQKGSDFGAIISPSPKEAEVGDQIFCIKVVK